MKEIQLKPWYVADVSGGKDSLFMLYKIMENPSMFPLDAIIHYKLEIDWEFTNNVCDKYKKLSKKLNIPYIEITPTRSFKELYEKYGMPTRRARWCNNIYKLDCKKQYEKYQKEHGYKVIHYIGFCADEVKRFKDNDDIYPLVQLGIEEKTILNWARNIPLFDNWYKVNDRQGCMFCPCLTRREQAYMLLHYPDKFNEYIIMIKEYEKKFGSNYFGKQTLESVLDKIYNKWLPIVKELEKNNSKTS